MNEGNKTLPEKKLPTEDAKSALQGALKSIPKSFLLKVIYLYFKFTFNNSITVILICLSLLY